MNSDSDNTPINKNDSNGIELFKPLSHLRTVFLEGQNVLIENDSILYSFFCVLFGYGFCLLLLPLLDTSFVLQIVLGLSLIIPAIFLIIYTDYYTVLNLSGKSFHKELRIASLILFKSKSVRFSNITEFGMDHKRKIKYGVKIPIFATSLIDYFLDIGGLRVYAKGKKYSPCKELDSVDGMVEKSAIAYLSSNGQIGYLNSFSDRQDADEINSELVEVLGIFTDKPAVVVESNVGLSVKKMGSKFKFEPYKLKPVMIGGDFATTILIFSVLFLIVLIIFILVYFEIL